MKKTQTKIYVLVGILSALSIILQFISIPIIPAAPFLKLEFSSIPMITLSIFYGRRYGILSAIIVNIIDALMKPSIVGFPLDQFVNVIAIIIFMFSIHYFIIKKQYILAIIIPVIANVMLLVLLNYSFITPLYFTIAKWPLPENLLLWCIQIYGTFNLIKWGSIAVIYVVIYQKKLIDLKSKLN